MSSVAERNLNQHLCKSLVFGFVNADSFCYFNNLYNPQVKFIYKYLRPMVIHCKRPNEILLILWGDMCDLSRILHYPGNDSIGFNIVYVFILLQHMGRSLRKLVLSRPPNFKGGVR